MVAAGVTLGVGAGLPWTGWSDLGIEAGRNGIGFIGLALIGAPSSGSGQPTLGRPQLPVDEERCGRDGTWHDGLLMDLLAGELREPEPAGERRGSVPPD